MGKGEGRPRRLRLIPGRASHAVVPQPVEPPRVEALEALLREVDGLRLTLETDLTLAAAAVESGIPSMAADILDSDRDSLRRFEERALGHLAELDTPAPRRSVWAQAHAAPIVAAAALVGVLVGVVPHVTSPSDATATTVAAADSLERLQQLAEHGDAAQVRAASAELHRQLAGVVANASADPEAAQTALLLLTYEQSAIVRSGDSTVLADVLRQSQALARAIVAQLPASARAKAPKMPAAAVEPSPSASPKPKPSPSPSASPSTRASSKPGPTPSPSRDSDPYPLPSPPLAP